MARNTITIFFDPCEPTPSNGYKITYRPLGSEGPFRTWPNVFTSPAEIVDDSGDPVGTDYEGFIQGDCGGDQLGVPVPWIADNSASLSVSASGSAYISASGSIAPPPGVIIEDAILSNELVTHCIQAPSTVYTDDGTISFGKTLYLDADLTSPVTGFDFVSKVSVGIVFNLNNLTGLVGSNTGESC